MILSHGYNGKTREALKIISSDSDSQPPLYIGLKDVYCPPSPTTCSTPVVYPTSLGTTIFSPISWGPRLGLPNLLTIICKIRVWAPAREIFLEHKPNHDTLLL